MSPCSEWQAALYGAEPGHSVGIWHAALYGDKDDRLHVAAIPWQVGCHYHRIGNEIYQPVQGEGILYCGKVGQSGSESMVAWEAPVELSCGDCFLIPPGCASIAATLVKKN